MKSNLPVLERPSQATCSLPTEEWEEWTKRQMEQCKIYRVSSKVKCKLIKHER